MNIERDSQKYENYINKYILGTIHTNVETMHLNEIRMHIWRVTCIMFLSLHLNRIRR